MSCIFGGIGNVHYQWICWRGGSFNDISDIVSISSNIFPNVRESITQRPCDRQISKLLSKWRGERGKEARGEKGKRKEWHIRFQEIESQNRHWLRT